MDCFQSKNQKSACQFINYRRAIDETPLLITIIFHGTFSMSNNFIPVSREKLKFLNQYLIYK